MFRRDRLETAGLRSHPWRNQYVQRDNRDWDSLKGRLIGSHRFRSYNEEIQMKSSPIRRRRNGLPCPFLIRLLSSLFLLLGLLLLLFPLKRLLLFDSFTGSLGNSLFTEFEGSLSLPVDLGFPACTSDFLSQKSRGGSFLDFPRSSTSLVETAYLRGKLMIPGISGNPNCLAK